MKTRKIKLTLVASLACATTAAGAVAMTPISAATPVAVAAVTIRRRGAQTRIRHQEMAATLAFAARWKAMAAKIAAIG